MNGTVPAKSGAIARLLTYAVAVLLTGAACASPWRLAVVSGKSMSPTLWPRELLAYDTSYFARHRIAVGDVVLFKRQGEVWVKRVFALPGSTFWAFKDYINGREWLRPIDPYVLSRFRALARSIRREGRYAEVVQHLVRPGCVFVLGDSSTGVDSRSIGEIPVIQILGRVVELPWQDLRPNGVHSEWSFPRRPGSRLI